MIVVVPVYERPEYLHLCLEAIREAHSGIDILVSVNHPDVGAPVSEFREVAMQHRARIKLRMPHSYPGATYNVLESLRDGYNTGADRVFIVEEDVLIERNFFRWHERAARLCCFAVCGWKRTPMLHVSIHNDVYESWGACFPRYSLPFIFEHCTSEYYSDMHGYIARHFDERLCPYFEQDGLINHVVIAGKLRVAFPPKRVCHHIGVHSYHYPDGHKFEGTLQERIAALREAVMTGAILNMGGGVDVSVP